jgi:hypothetical protein
MAFDYPYDGECGQIDLRPVRQCEFDFYLPIELMRDLLVGSFFGQFSLLDSLLPAQQ